MMKIEDLQYYDYDSNHPGDLIATCTGKRGKFVGNLEMISDDEKIKYLTSFQKITVAFNKKGRSYSYTLQNTITPEEYERIKIKNPGEYEDNQIERLIKNSLNGAYEYYKRV